MENYVEASDFESVFFNWVADSREYVTKEGDYLDAEGFRCCGKCHTRKERDVRLESLGGKVIRVGMACECLKREEEALSRKLAAEALEIRRSKADDSGDFPKEYAQYTFERDRDPEMEVSRHMRTYATQFDEVYEKAAGLYLYNSDCDTGKTFYASCIANAVFDMGYNVLIDTYANVCERLQDFGADKERTLYLIRNAALVVLDEFGGERKTEYIQQKGYTVIDERVKAKKPLIITSNIPFDDLRNSGDLQNRRIYSRLTEAVTPVLVPRGSRTREAIGNAKAKYLERLWNK